MAWTEGRGKKNIKNYSLPSTMNKNNCSFPYKHSSNFNNALMSGLTNLVAFIILFTNILLSTFFHFLSLSLSLIIFFFLFFLINTLNK